jgi:hypothetical protein
MQLNDVLQDPCLQQENVTVTSPGVVLGPWRSKTHFCPCAGIMDSVPDS